MDLFCTYAVTGSHTRWQPIFLCQDCSNNNEDVEAETHCCICDACAHQCHKDCNVEYIGMGPSYCDCGHNEGYCQIIEESRMKARELKCEDLNCNEDKGTKIDIPPLLVAQQMKILGLEDPDICKTLIGQARKLVTISRDTHWLNFDASPDQLCGLELLALQILKWHTRANNFENMVGAEWWVQVKDLSSNAAVDLHYDKDEKLAESFGLGYFPLLSTVSYLSENAYPTLVLPNRFDEAEDEDMTSMLVSHPRLGKHLTFDGRLLHGAPAHPSLIRHELEERPATKLKGLRVTFLVNLWQKAPPTGIKILSSSIQDKLNNSLSEKMRKRLSSEIILEQEAIPSIKIDCKDDLPQGKNNRVILPFVSSGATWIDDDEENLTLITFPSPYHESDTVNVEFGPGMQAYLDYSNNGVEEHQDLTDPITLPYISAKGVY